MEKKLWRKTKVTDSGYKEPISGIQDLLGNGRDLNFACRLAFEEGPWHHAYANSILLRALLKGCREISDRLNVPMKAYPGEVVEVPMHRPPHLHHISASGVYPTDLPISVILELADGDEKRAEEMIEALTEGPPHHVMANIIMVHLAEALMALARNAAHGNLNME
jgi:hypothetical protein